MQVTVALTPSMLRAPARHAVAVVDVLRASTSLVTMLENGLKQAVVAENIQEARKLALSTHGLLCGEVRSVQPAGFDYGNSPAEFDGLSFKGQTAVLMTTNGTRAIGAVAEAPFVAVATLLNRGPVARRLVAEATKRKVDIGVVCAGTERGSAFSLEDTAAAGAIVEAAIIADPTLHLADAAWSALHLWRWYRGDALKALRESKHGRALAELGFGADLEYAARVDVSRTVPVLQRQGELRVLRRTRGPD